LSDEFRSRCKTPSSLRAAAAAAAIGWAGGGTFKGNAQGARSALYGLGMRVNFNQEAHRRKALSAVVLVIAAAGMPIAGHAARLVVDVDVAPPPVRVEVVPGPRVGYVWAPGYWRWNRGRHVWVRGYWIRERRGYHWVPQRWEERGKRWRFETGRWARD
jgi:hypothetical protein